MWKGNILTWCRYCVNEEVEKYSEPVDQYAVKTMDDGDSPVKGHASKEATMLLKAKSGNQKANQTNRTPLPTKSGSGNVQKREKERTIEDSSKADEKRRDGKRAIEESETETSPAKRYAAQVDCQFL